MECMSGIGTTKAVMRQGVLEHVWKHLLGPLCHCSVWVAAAQRKHILGIFVKLDSS